MWLQAALDHVGSGFGLADVRGMVERGEAHLWPLKRSAMVTTIGQYPQRRVCRIWLAGGDLAELQEPAVEIAVERYALAAGCSAIEIIGRPGWERVFSGVRRQAVILTRELDHG